MKYYSLSHILSRLRGDSPFRFLERIWTTIRVSIRESAWDLLLGFVRLFHADGLCLRPTQGGRILLDLRDKGITRELFFAGIREVEASHYLRTLLKPGQVVYDVGANIGYYVILESSLVGASGKVIAVEPIPSNFRLLEKNVAANQLGNVELHQCAMGDAEGTAEMFVMDKSNWCSMHEVPHAVVTARVTVPTHTLDQFVQGRPPPYFVRMDVEGYETHIIRGMRGILQSGIPLSLFIEIHPHIMKREDLVEMLQTLAAAGLRVDRFFDNIAMQSDQIAELLANDDFMSGRRGSALAFFVRP